MPRKVECQNGSDPSKAQKMQGKTSQSGWFWVAFLFFFAFLRFSFPVVVVVVVLVCGKDLNARANVLR